MKFRIIIHSIVALFCLVMINGCATQMIKSDQPPSLVSQPNSSLLVIMRETAFGGAVVFQNYLDGKFIGETNGLSYFVTNVSPGRHYLMSKAENIGVAQLNFEPGKKYFLGQGVTIGWWKARTTGFYPIKTEQREKALQDCTYLQLDGSKKYPDLTQEEYQGAIKEYEEDIKLNPEGYRSLIEYKGE